MAKISFREKRLVRRTIKSIDKKIDYGNLPFLDNLRIHIQPIGELVQVRKDMQLNLDRYADPIPTTKLYVAEGLGAIGLYYATSKILEDRSHRFIISANGEIEYARQSFNVDCQAIGSTVIELAGYRQVLENGGAFKEFLSLPNKQIRPMNLALASGLSKR